MISGASEFLIRAQCLRLAALGATDPIIGKLLFQLAQNFEEEALRSVSAAWNPPNASPQNTGEIEQVE